MFRKHFSNAFKSLLGSEYIRILVGYIRWFYYVKIFRKLKTTEESTENSIDKTISHNLIVFDRFPLTDFAMKRMDNLLNAIGGIQSLDENSNFLIIGPRTESDILNLKGKFYSNHISAIDLITYSPWIEIQDMHAIDYADNQFDCVICGWTISYSTNPDLALANMIRVVKNEGFIAIGVEHVSYNKYTKIKDIDSRELDHYTNNEALKNRLNTTTDFENLFKSSKVNYDIVFKFGEKETILEEIPDAKYHDNVMIIAQIFK